MTITSSKPLPHGSSGLRHRRLVECQDFFFQLDDVDGFYYAVDPDKGGQTVVHYLSYTATIADPDRTLFEFLKSKFKKS